MGSNIITESTQRLAEQRELHHEYRALLSKVVRVPEEAFDAATDDLPVDDRRAERLIRDEAGKLIYEADLFDTLRGLARHFDVKAVVGYLYSVQSETMEGLTNRKPIIAPVLNRIEEDKGIDPSSILSNEELMEALKQLAILLEVADRLTVV